MDLLSTIQELQMVDALVRLEKWPKTLAEDVVRQVSHEVDASQGVWGQLDDLLQTLKVEKRITVLQALAVRQYITALQNKRELRPDLLGRRAAEDAHGRAAEDRHGRFHGRAATARDCTKTPSHWYKHEHETARPPITLEPPSPACARRRERGPREPEPREDEPEYATGNPYFVATVEPSRSRGGVRRVY
jgi:hypothetical protein